ncbi:HD family hydrolase [Acuticoccus sp. M5D2P5]|uniref:HD domain-containing protein n=1 Tax=Acuticoccus kalidii TaxID=2910977 RepID=UPI001F3B7947|nr:HD family hydrolase [Acuticoccus kalidii]MCF3936094.1 HD family hydrolase [Acuticoccus kalidii]
MLSGRRLDLLDPSPLDIEIVDIAHGLARVARWNGQTVGEYPYSVAQHSLLVEAIFSEASPAASPGDRLAALLHDAPEYVVGDLISPFKAVIGAAYKGVEARLSHAVHLRFAIPADGEPGRSKRIKLCDTIAAYHEAVSLAGFSEVEARQIFGAPQIGADALVDYLYPWPTDRAERTFLERFEALEAALQA